MFLKISQMSQEKTYVGIPWKITPNRKKKKKSSNTLHLKKTPAEVFPCELCEIVKKIFFTEYI